MTMPTKTVFISSTKVDLEEYRNAARDVVLAFGYFPAMMNYFGPTQNTPVDESKRRVVASEIFIGIYAYRYGHIPPDSKVSITELEFDWAFQHNIPQLCFFVDETIRWNVEHFEGEPGQSKLNKLKDRIRTAVTLGTFTSPDHLKAEIAIALHNLGGKSSFALQTAGSQQNVLGQYKIRDVLKPIKYEETRLDTSKPRRADLMIFLDDEIEDFDENTFLDSVSIAANVSIDEIVVIQIIEGSVLIHIRLPESAANLLYKTMTLGQNALVADGQPRSQQMSHVFISYSREDRKFADTYVDELKRRRFEVWLDTVNIDPGDEFPKRIIEAIDTCKAMLIFMSPRAARSWYVMRELTYALEFGKLVIPVLLDGDPWPLLQKKHYAESPADVIRTLTQLAKFFICRATEDEEFAGQLEEDLANLGADIWVEYDDEVSINAGLDASQIMLLIVSPAAMESNPAIQSQWQAFFEAGKPIIPILVQQTLVPAAIHQIQPYVDFLNQEYEIAFSQLYGVLVNWGVSMDDHEILEIPAQPRLTLAGSALVSEAREEVWISGITLDYFAMRPYVLTDVVQQSEVTVRLLMLALEVPVINEMGEWLGINTALQASLPDDPEFDDWVDFQKEEYGQELTEQGHWVAKRLFRNQRIFHDEVLQKAPNNIQVKTVNLRLSNGYFIIDPKASDGKLGATPYFFQMDQIKKEGSSRYNAPIYLSKLDAKEFDIWWFDRYVDEFERLWAFGTELVRP